MPAQCCDTQQSGAHPRAGVVITAVDAFLFLFIDRLGARRLEAFFAVLIGVMATSFGYIFLCVLCDRHMMKPS